MPDLNHPTIYQIRVRGQLDESWADWFDNMTITVDCESEDQPTTTLTCIMVDQAALQGILRRIHDLNLSLISVSEIKPNSIDH